MKNDKMKNQYRVNEQIRVREVRIVSDGESTVMPTRHALDMAREQGVDLVEISPNAQPQFVVSLTTASSLSAEEACKGNES